MGIIINAAVPVIGLTGMMKNRTGMENQQPILWRRILKDR